MTNALMSFTLRRKAARQAVPERVTPQPASGATQVYLGSRPAIPVAPVRRVSK